MAPLEVRTRKDGPIRIDDDDSSYVGARTAAADWSELLLTVSLSYSLGRGGFLL